MDKGLEGLLYYPNNDSGYKLVEPNNLRILEQYRYFKLFKKKFPYLLEYRL